MPNCYFITFLRLKNCIFVIKLWFKPQNDLKIGYKPQFYHKIMEISHIFCPKPKIWQISNNNQLNAFWSTHTFSMNSLMDKHVVILISVYLVDNVNRLATYFSHNFLIFISQYIEKVLKYQDFWSICKKNSSYSLYGLLIKGYNLKNVNFC